MTGYNDNPEATAAAIYRHGWLHTGDLGTMDAQGFVRITGRVKDMIIRGGENYFPAKIEAALVSHPDVLQVAVVDLRAHCQGVLSVQKKPSLWVLVPEFPLTGSGKVQKFAIRQQFLTGNRGLVL